MSNLQQLNAFLTERFNTVAVEICGEVEKTLTVYQEEISRSKEEIDRLRRLLHIVTQPKIKLHRTDAQQLIIPEEEVHPGHQHNKQEWSLSLGQDPEPTQIKEETEELMTSQEEKCKGLESDNSILKFSDSFVKSDFSQINPHTCSQLFHTQTLKNREQDLLSASTTEEIKTEPDEDCYRLATQTSDSQSLSVEAPYSSVSAFNKCQLIDMADKPYQCNVCGKFLKRERSLIVHRMGHAGEKPFTCPICNKGFVALGTLKTHLKLHTGERPHRCFVCGRCFKLKGALTEHMRIHTGEKPFRCQDCGKCFSRTNALTNHMLQIHKKKRT
ncbi:putative zinc finger protein 66 [Esox lucius]|uniref:putative zinc finger protein 66 n=1 Tax=Esox lucius TaxID=8010 RepID=UPI0014777344|nr:putative zinc finger protein 66 [Esox lucius]